MDDRQERERQLKALNLLGVELQIEMEGGRLRGEVFYFNQKAVILKKDNEFIFVNVANPEHMRITPHPTQRTHEQLKEILAEEIAKPSQILSYILD